MAYQSWIVVHKWCIRTICMLFSSGAWPVSTTFVLFFLYCVNSSFVLPCSVVWFSLVFQPYPVFFTDVVQLKAPGMGPDSAEHLEITEEFGPGAAPAPLHSIPYTCTQGKECEEADGCVFALWTGQHAINLFIHTDVENVVQQNVTFVCSPNHLSMESTLPTSSKSNVQVHEPNISSISHQIEIPIVKNKAYSLITTVINFYCQCVFWTTVPNNFDTFTMDI